MFCFLEGLKILNFERGVNLSAGTCLLGKYIILKASLLVRPASKSTPRPQALLHPCIVPRIPFRSDASPSCHHHQSAKDRLCPNVYFCPAIKVARAFSIKGGKEHTCDDDTLIKLSSTSSLCDWNCNIATCLIKYFKFLPVVRGGCKGRNRTRRRVCGTAAIPGENGFQCTMRTLFTLNRLKRIIDSSDKLGN